MSEPAAQTLLDWARYHAGMTVLEVWFAYFGLGGMSSLAAVEATLCGLVPTDRVEHDLLAQAINDSFVEDGTNHPVPYFNELEPEGGSTTG